MTDQLQLTGPDLLRLLNWHCGNVGESFQDADDCDLADRILLETLRRGVFVDQQTVRGLANGWRDIDEQPPPHSPFHNDERAHR